MDLNGMWFELAVIGLLVAILTVLITIAIMGTTEAGKLPDWLTREPIRVRAAGAAIIGAIVTLLASLGINVDPKVQAAIIGLIGTVAVAISELSRPKVTPVDAPDSATIEEAKESTTT